MILSALISLPLFLFDYFLLLFPTTAVSVGVASAISSAISALWALNSFIPVPTLGIVVGVLISVEISIFVFKLIRFLLSHIPFIGGKGV